MSFKKVPTAKGRRRWTEADAREVLEDLDRSRQTVSEFAESRGLSAQRLYRWRQRLSDRASSEAPPSDLVPVHVRVEGRLTGSAPVMVVRLGGEVVVEILPSAPPAWVATLLSELEER